MKFVGNQYSLISLSVLLALSGSVNAAGTYMEARNDAMGGTGVASSHYGTAPLANPALMSSFGKSDDFSLILPSVGAQVTDPNNMQDGLKQVKDARQNYANELGTGRVSAATAKEYKSKLIDLNKAKTTGQVSAGIVTAVPNSVMPFALVIKSWGTATLEGKVNGRDLQYLDGVANGTINPTDAGENALTSHMIGRAATITDVGIAFAKEFEINGVKSSIGITPKYQRVDLYNNNMTLKNYTGKYLSAKNYLSTQSNFNGDIGFATYPTDHWTLGLVAQNIVPRMMESKEINGFKETFKVRTQVTTGVSWHNDFFTGAMDVDLTPASGFAKDEKRQFASVGAELNAWDWAQLRAGYRQNIMSNSGSALTAGVGLSPFGVIHVDVAAIKGTDRTYGAVAQLSFTF
ncbi:conjugal transfer protein TraF [Serratia sp. Leaf50]|nr:conjugal transfer protein TraF [Serratia sp. Leaf50]